MRIVLVKPNYKTWWSRRRKWIPVYWPSHCDPELSKQAANPHYHIAWNRLPEKAYPKNSAIVVWKADILEVKIPKKTPPIIGKSHAAIDWKRNLPGIPFPEAWKNLGDNRSAHGTDLAEFERLMKQ